MNRLTIFLVLVIIILAAVASSTTAIALSSRDAGDQPTQPRVLHPSTRTPIEEALYWYDLRRQSEEAEREHWRQQLSFD